MLFSLIQTFFLWTLPKKLKIKVLVFLNSWSDCQFHLGQNLAKQMRIKVLVKSFGPLVKEIAKKYIWPANSTAIWRIYSPCNFMEFHKKLRSEVIANWSFRKIHLCLKVGHSPPPPPPLQKKIFASMIALKNDRNAFYFTLKALSVLKVFKFLSWLFGHGEKTARLERWG